MENIFSTKTLEYHIARRCERDSKKREIYLAKWSADGVLKALMLPPHGDKRCTPPDAWSLQPKKYTICCKAATLWNMGNCPIWLNFTFPGNQKEKTKKGTLY